MFTASKELFMSHFRGGHGFIVPPQRINGKSFSMENIGKGLFFVRLRSKTGLDIDN